MIGEVVITPEMVEIISELQKDTTSSEIQDLLDEMSNVYISITQDEMYTPESRIGVSFLKVFYFLRDMRKAIPKK